MWYTPAERNRFTGEAIMRIIRVRKTIIDEGTVAIGVVIRLTKVAVMTIEGSVIIITGTEAEIAGIGMTTSAKRPSDRLKTKKVMIERGATKIIIIGMTGGIVEVIATETTEIDAGIAATAMNGIDDTPGTTGPRIDIGMSVRATTRRGIARDRDRDRGTAHHRYHLER